MNSESRLPRPIRALERPYSYISRALLAASYPLRGIAYFLRHPAYYPLFLSRLLPLSLLSLLIYFILFTFAFLPQFAFLYIFHGRGAWLNAIVLVLGEGLVIIQGLFEGFFVDECRVDVFDVSLTRQCSLRRCTWKADTGIGYPYRTGPCRRRRATSPPLPRCPELCQNARQAIDRRSLSAVEPDPDCRTHRLPAAQPDSVGGHAGVHYHHGRAVGVVRALQMVQAAGSDAQGAQVGDQGPQVGIHLVRNGRDAAGARAYPVVFLLADLDYGRGALDCEDRRTNTWAGGGPYYRPCYQRTGARG